MLLRPAPPVRGGLHPTGPIDDLEREDERFSWVEGSHLFPFERPRETVAEVLSWLRRFESQANR